MIICATCLLDQSNPWSKPGFRAEIRHTRTDTFIFSSSICALHCTELYKKFETRGQGLYPGSYHLTVARGVRARTGRTSMSGAQKYITILDFLTKSIDDAGLGLYELSPEDIPTLERLRSYQGRTSRGASFDRMIGQSSGPAPEKET